MSNGEDEPRNDQPALFVGGRLDALQGLIEPPPLSDAQKDIIGWYNELVGQLAGPASGDSRGPAQRPPWIVQAPAIDGIAMEVEREILIQGSGFRGLTDVWVEGRLPDSWQVVSDSELLVAVGDDVGERIRIEIRSPGGTADAFIDIAAEVASE